MIASYLRGVALSIAFGGLACSRVAPTEPSSHPPPASAAGAVLVPALSQSSASAAVADAGSEGSSPTGEPTWQATLVEANGLDLGDFAVAAPPAPGHPSGIVSALGWTEGDPPDVYAVAIDVATAREVERLRIGVSVDRGAAMITSTPGGVVVALQGKKTIELTWIDGGNVLGARRSLPGLGVDSDYDLRGFAGYDDRLVLADGGNGATTLRVLDGKGHLVFVHKCLGDLFRPGPAALERIGDQVVLTNLMTEDGSTPLCSLPLRGGATWHETRLPPGNVKVWQGALYFTSDSDDAARALGPDLRPTGQAVTFPAETPTPSCSGLTGTSPSEAATVGEFEVVYMISCCGDPSPGGLFVCRPDGRRP